MYTILRVIRGVLGAFFVIQIMWIANATLALITLFRQNIFDGIGDIFGIMIIKVLALLIFGYLFFGLRTFTNWLHTKNRGVPHPSLSKKWNL